MLKTGFDELFCYFDSFILKPISSFPPNYFHNLLKFSDNLMREIFLVKVKQRDKK